MNKEPQGVAPEIAPGHNPDSLTVAQVGEGWRLLDKDECDQPENEDWPFLEQIEGRGAGDEQWLSGKFAVAPEGMTYRTRLSREELRAARGLDPEPAPEPLCVCGHRKGTHWPECQVSAYNSCPCNAFRPAQPAQEAEPASAQAISAEERAREILRKICKFTSTDVDEVAAALTAHAAQEVSRVEGNFNRMREIANQRMDELAQLRAEIARLREELDGAKYDLESQKIAHRKTAEDATAVRDERDQARAEAMALRDALREALEYGGGRWSEWGERAETVEAILEKALAAPSAGHMRANDLELAVTWYTNGRVDECDGKEWQSPDRIRASLGKEGA